MTENAAVPLLQVQGLKAWYGAAQILFDVSLQVGRGEVVALMGRNGAGKSTTLKALMGMVARRGSVPERDEINPEINEALVVEFYNKIL